MNGLPLAGAIAVLTALSFFQFPGHTWLQSDTQIYAPILEHLRDPAALSKEMLVIRPHVSYTIYDECARALRGITGLGFENALAAIQMATRALGIWGIYLMAAAAGLTAWPALLVAAIFTLGGTIAGPSVLLWEYEPVPRGFAIPLLYLGAGLAAHGRYVAAGSAGAVAFLFHPPSVYPFCAVYAAMALWPGDRQRKLRGLLPLLGAILLLIAAARFQAGEREAQPFFTRLDAIQEKLQRMRASYVWVSMWWRNLWLHYAIAFLIALAASLRLRGRLRMLLIGLSVVGVASMPLSYLLLEKLKWALMPQFQPLRALLFVTASALFGAAVMGCRAAMNKRTWEAIGWFALAYAVPMRVTLPYSPGWERMLLLLALGLACSLALRTRPIAVAACALAPFFLLPAIGKITNYPKLRTPALAQLSQWARTSTPADAVFLFPDADRDLAPGIFRAEALRAVYVDWKGGGQVNYLKELGELWWSRWQEAMGTKFDPKNTARFREMGIDYLVVKPKNALPGAPPVFENAAYAAYALR